VVSGVRVLFWAHPTTSYVDAIKAAGLADRVVVERSEARARLSPSGSRVEQPSAVVRSRPLEAGAKRVLPTLSGRLLDRE